MLNVIVTVDFSLTSLNAAKYAVQMYASRSDAKIILYHYYDNPDEADNARTLLESLQTELSAQKPEIEIQVESGDNFIDSLAAHAHSVSAYMIVMGLTGKSSLMQRFSGSNTLKMAEKNICPVLIVPHEAQYDGMKNVLITSEMKHVQETPALLAVKRVLADFKPSLHILNVDSSHHLVLTEEYKTERDKMEALLAEFDPEFYFMRLFDFQESVELFVADKHIDMVIIAPKYHSFFESLFKTQHTKSLIYHSKVPVLAVHE
jgi:nucleotide-binding universal stress UspA family protein